MASETFLKIAKLTKSKFVTINERDHEPYIHELIRAIPENFKDLEPHHKLIVYEALGWIISSEQQPHRQIDLVN